MTELLDVMSVPATGDPTSAVLDSLKPQAISEVRCDVLVVGGGTGGTAAALAAARAGRHVCLLEETDWLGGQFTAQGVSALDEHAHIESFGGTRSYYQLRELIRDTYRARSPRLAAQSYPNPGNCWVTRLAFEPRVAIAALDAMLKPYVDSGLLRIFRRTKAYSANVSANRIDQLLAVQLDERRWFRFLPQLVIDATELGDVLPLADAEHVIGAEALAQTGEAHAQPVEAKAHCVQSFTYPFVLEWAVANPQNIIAQPPHYAQYRDSQPYSLRIHVHGGEIYGEETRWLQYQVAEQAPDTRGSLWTYRRLIDATQFPAGYPNDISMFNWPGNDYRDESVLTQSAVQQAHAFQRAKQVSLGFLHWLQTEVARPGSAPGFPEFRTRGDVFGTSDALGKHPYIRESRRILAAYTVVEQDVSADFQSGARARHFADSVGVGWYPIDIHQAGADDVGVSCRTKPFQIPLGALIPVRLTNLLAGAKNIGTTHITNGCYRLHPIEWNIGEASGALAAFALATGKTPLEVWNNPALTQHFQGELIRQGLPLYWFTDIPLGHPSFEAIQRAVMRGEIEGSPESLEFAALPSAIRNKWGGVTEESRLAVNGFLTDSADCVLVDAPAWDG